MLTVAGAAAAGVYSLLLLCLLMLNIQVNSTTGALKVFRNEDCLKCELGVGVYSFSCYNPFLRRKSAGKLRLALFYSLLVSLIKHSDNDTAAVPIDDTTLKADDIRDGIW